MTDILQDERAPAHPVPARRSMVVVPRVHDGSGTRVRYGLVPAELSPGAQMLTFPQGPVVDREELRAGGALLLEEEFGSGMSAAVIAPLGVLYADQRKEERIDALLAVARRTDAEYGDALEPAGIPGVEWVDAQSLLELLRAGRIGDTTTASAVALLLACGELVD
ncbi:hypothetical protein [uncultured Kocuria sp.]|uniref:hypothetical protein n=1 Tax=uncultured Kocuria sp. TaxID=259305 RepID=UPI0026312AB6|nr:hypothetical protein [uncultured Kocuria sp.]